MKFLGKFFKLKVTDKSDNGRLARARNERPLREGFNQEHYLNVLEARQYVFNETTTIKRVGNKRV